MAVVLRGRPLCESGLSSFSTFCNFWKANMQRWILLGLSSRKMCKTVAGAAMLTCGDIDPGRGDSYVQSRMNPLPETDWFPYRDSVIPRRMNCFISGQLCGSWLPAPIIIIPVHQFCEIPFFLLFFSFFLTSGFCFVGTQRIFFKTVIYWYENAHWEEKRGRRQFVEMFI